MGRGGTVSLAETKFLTVAQYNWCYVAGTIERYFVDDTKNKSLQQHIDWANKKIDNLRNSLTDAMETYLFGDGTGNGSLDPDGLGNIVATAPTTGTVGGLNRATYTWYQNRTKAASGPASVALLSDMRNLSNTCSEGITRNYPNIIITTQTVSELYDDEVLEQRQIVNQSSGDGDFTKTFWKGIPLVWSSQCPSGRMYMLNSEYFSLVIDPDVNFMMTSWKEIPNQVEDRVAQIIVKCNFVSSRPKSLGVITGIA